MPQSSKPVRPFSLLVKPASADCNLRCEYCFYLDRCELYPDAKVHRMSDQVLEAMVRTYLATDQPQHSFGWQGGEPTLMGLEFFQKAIGFQRAYGDASRAVVSNGLQTNTTLIDDDFARHLAKFNYLVGVSVDGPEEIHNHYRHNAGGGDTHGAVMKGLAALKRNRVEYNILTLVSQSNVEHAAEVYQYLLGMDCLYQQYIPCVEFDSDGDLLPFAISGEQWGDFLCEIFDQWYPQDTRKVSVRMFDSILTKMVDDVYNVCHMGRDCRQYFVVEYNGDVYPCDFFVKEPLKLGNVLTDSWADMQDSDKYRKFGAMKPQWHEDCDNCDYLNFCSGDCLKHRIEQPGGNPQTLSSLCAGWKKFYPHTLKAFRKLADDVRRERAETRGQMHTEASGQPAQSVGRNEPCPCGSGKKYKKCCGK
jgi:uncharacterized protein